MRRKSSSQAWTQTQENHLTKVMVAVDSPEGAERPAEFALDLATMSHAELVLVHVKTPSLAFVPPFGAGMPVVLPARAWTTDDGDEEKTSRWMTRFTWAAEERGLKAKSKVVPADVPVAERVIDEAEKEDVDLLVTGAKDWSTMERLLFGSVSSDIVKKAKIPVLVVRSTAAGNDEAKGAASP